MSFLALHINELVDCEVNIILDRDISKIEDLELIIDGIISERD